MVTNLTREIAREFRDLAPSTAYERIRDDTGLSLSTLQRVMSGTTGPSIDTLAVLAHRLGTTVPELLTPRKDVLPAQQDDAAAAQRLRRRAR